jgi:arsenite-transporting ATPase
VLARSGESFSLSLALPFTEPGEVELARLGDDRLALTVGADRRVLTLPSVLRRCEVDGAALRGDRLVISFVPDPALWPRTRSGLPA